jgi:hypothetical protein
VRQWAVAGFAVIAACLVLLVINEVFGHPPLMTPRPHLTADMRGVWSHGAILFEVASDAAVSGRYGDVQFAGKLRRNRTWFGKWMNWRTDYIILGSFSDGRPISVPVQWTGNGYTGSVFIGPNYKAAGPVSFTATRHI